jgi:hypothetical protein
VNINKIFKKEFISTHLSVSWLIDYWWSAAKGSPSLHSTKTDLFSNSHVFMSHSIFYYFSKFFKNCDSLFRIECHVANHLTMVSGAFFEWLYGLIIKYINESSIGVFRKTSDWRGLTWTWVEISSDNSFVEYNRCGIVEKTTF